MHHKLFPTKIVYLRALSILELNRCLLQNIGIYSRMWFNLQLSNIEDKEKVFETSIFMHINLFIAIPNQHPF